MDITQVKANKQRKFAKNYRKAMQKEAKRYSKGKGALASMVKLAYMQARKRGLSHQDAINSINKRVRRAQSKLQ